MWMQVCGGGCGESGDEHYRLGGLGDAWEPPLHSANTNNRMFDLLVRFLTRTLQPHIAR